MPKLPAPRSGRLSYTKHRQDVARQIILPVAFVAVMVLVLVVLTLVGFQNGGDVSKWAAVATIWMVIPLMALLLVLMVVGWGVVYLLGQLLEVSPRYTSKAQEYALWFNAQVILWTDKIIEPILQLKAWLRFFTPAEKESEEKLHG